MSQLQFVRPEVDALIRNYGAGQEADGYTAILGADVFHRAYPRANLACEECEQAKDHTFHNPEIEGAEEYHEYKAPVPDFNTVLYAFRPTPEQLEKLIAGEDIYIGLLTYGRPVQGIIAGVGVEFASAVYNVPIKRTEEPAEAVAP